MAAAASLGLCFLGALAAPANAAHHHHRHGHAESSKPEPPKKPEGPLLLAISLGGQRVTVYDNGTPIASSRISTGMPGHPTPMGIFSIIQKQRWHRSNIYSGAPMPYMQRITWSGVALHAGVVPGYPASHGCIRLPEGFAVRLWGMTKIGARVVITRGNTAPYEIDNPHLAALVKPPEADAAPNGSTKPDGAKDDSKPEGAKPAGVDASHGAVVVATTGAASASDARKGAPADSAHADSAHADSAHADSAHGEPGQSAPTSQAATADPAKVDPAPAKGGAAAAPAQTPTAPPQPPGEDVLRKPGQLSLFVSRRAGKLFVRKGFTPAFDVPITIEQPDKPLGTHIFTASRPPNKTTGIRWLGVSLYDRPPAPRSHRRHRGRHVERERPAPVTAETLRQSAVDALNRIELPPDVVARLRPLVVPGTSLVISDHGLGGETGKDTDFIVVTR